MIHSKKKNNEGRDEDSFCPFCPGANPIKQFKPLAGVK